MPLYVADFQIDTMDLAADEIGVYLSLLMLAWRRSDGAIPADMKWLKRSLQSCLAGFHGHAFNRIVPKILARFFVLESGVYTNKRLTKELQKVRKLSAKQSENVGKRWAKTKENNALEDTNVIPHTHTHTHITQVSKKDTRESAPCDGWPSYFEDEFWSVWPNKVGKPAAMKALAAARKRKVPFGAIIDGVWTYIRDKPPDRQWLNPATFLNQNRWEDQPATVRPLDAKPRSPLIQAADNLCRKIAEFDGPPRQPEQLRSGAGETVTRMLSNGRG